MRHASAGRRSRNRGNGSRRNGQNKMQVFDSNGPDVRIRGTAYQICEKYQTLAKDAASMGDKIVAESYLQHAEHYQRIILSWQERDEPVSTAGSDAEDAYAKENRNKRQKPVAPRGNGLDRAAEAAKDDLSLPSSILNPSAQAKSQKMERGIQSRERTLEEA